MATKRPLFEVGYIPTFFMRNEIFSDDIRKCPPFCILILHSCNQWRNHSFESGWKI